MPESSPGIQPNFLQKIISSLRPHSKETSIPTENKLQSIIERTEAGVSRTQATKGYDEQPRQPGKRINMCGVYSDAVTHLSRQVGLKSDIFQVRKLHELLVFNHMKIDPDQHAFSTVTGPDGQSFLVDLSIGQFLQGERINQQNNPLIQELLQNGYVPLTDDNLQQYLLFTNPKMDHHSLKRLKKVRVSDLSRVPSLDYDRREEGLKKFE